MIMLLTREFSWTLLGLALLLATNSHTLSAATPVHDKKPAHWLEQFQNELQAPMLRQNGNMQGEIKFVFGNNIWQPGKQFKNGSDWLALSCDSRQCNLEAAVLNVKSKKWQGHYDDMATPGQQLQFRPLVKSKNKVIAWFNTSVVPAWLKPGNIKTYYSGIGQPKQTGNGTLETLVELPSGDFASLVPMLLSASESPELMEKFTTNDSSSSILLQLRSHGKRQLLLGILGSCSRSIDGQGYLLWAGDLDGDDSPDYLISFIDDDGPVHLYLSGAAKPRELVGLVGMHYSPPYGGECDGGGWGL